ncbi:hypothetical protein C8J57DRAFT_704389 [Mycena rebaudengoi]|nr:hypothetical protein C8J57DRAFT_704389 [Mycena rebaudengoi]
MEHPRPPYYAPQNHHDSQDSTTIPVGNTRCYWALLSADLQFIYLDPVLANHLGAQAEELVGKSLLTFVHPDEQASAKQDLGSVLESRTLHGSVTRVRFSRLSRVRRELGYKGPPPAWTDAEKIALDSNYMAVDIVINWAAEGLVLCFIHAIVDLAPNDNDEAHKTAWTNWCGTPQMNMAQIELLFRRLLVCIPQLNNMTRVFQILANEQSRRLLISWPPDQGQGPAGRDFAKLVEDVQIGPGAPTGNEAKTSCTRRYKALQAMPAVAGEVESIFIPHGSVIFACHKVNAPSRTATTTSTMQQIGYNTSSYSGQTPYYEPHGSSYPVPPPSAPYNYLAPSAQPSPVPTPYSPRWSQSQGEQPAASYGGQWTASSTQGHTSNLRSGSYPPPQGQQWPSQPPSYTETPDTNGPTFQQRPLSPAYGYGSPSEEPTTPTTDVVPPPRRRVSPGSKDSSNGRSGSNRPTGVLKCSSCKATQSPEWRKGPSGKKELCNACGLRYARSRAKKEGTTNQAQRKRKDKGVAAAATAVKRGASATPPTPVTPSSASYSALRHNYDETSFSSAGSGSGSEAYPQLDGSTPSPSPPASSMNFVHYSPGDNHAHYSASGANPYYSVPSPLSNPPVQSGTNGQQSYSERVASMHTGSPAAHSPLTSTAPSFERDRERDLLPSAPISAESRVPRRSILAQQ